MPRYRYTVLDLHELPEDGKGFELEDGWLIEVAASSRHNWALRALARIIERAAADAGSQVVVCDGGEWEISTPAGVRKPDVFVVPRETARAAIVEESPKLIPDTELLMVADGTYTAAPTIVEGTRLAAGIDPPAFSGRSSYLWLMSSFT